MHLSENYSICLLVLRKTTCELLKLQQRDSSKSSQSYTKNKEIEYSLSKKKIMGCWFLRVPLNVICRRNDPLTKDLVILKTWLGSYLRHSSVFVQQRFTRMRFMKGVWIEFLLHEWQPCIPMQHWIIYMRMGVLHHLNLMWWIFKERLHLYSK